MKVDYRVMWWDARGNAQISEVFSKDRAETFAKNMRPEQEARLVPVISR